jgi:hypothetical protein
MRFALLVLLVLSACGGSGPTPAPFAPVICDWTPQGGACTWLDGQLEVFTAVAADDDHRAAQPGECLACYPT